MSEKGDQQYKPRDVVFVDTNAVHYSKITLAIAADRQYDVFAEGVASFKEQLRNWAVGAIDDYEKGYWILRYLQRRCEDRTDLLYSPITQLELLCGSLRGEAIKRAVSVGVPNRWFSRVREREICEQLEPDGYEQVQKDQANIELLFESAGIILIAPPVDRELWGLGQALMENVFIDVQDCLIYASALAHQASELITTDSHLRNTAGWTHNPGSAQEQFKDRFGSVRNAVVRACAEWIGCNEDEVVVPQNKGIPEIKQFFNGGAG